MREILDRFSDRLSFGEKKVLEIFLKIEGDRVFKALSKSEDPYIFFKKLSRDLLVLEDFYCSIGGVYGYYDKVSKLLKGEALERGEKFFSPPIFDISKENREVFDSIERGIEVLSSICEIYPVGGAGDRLSLLDDRKRPLPAAKLPFFGKSLLELLIRDLQARENIYYKRFKKRIRIPAVLMTSDDKDNDRHILELLEEKRWFGRDRDDFFIMKQPLVPMVDERGRFVLKKEGGLFQKPSGHGALWKVMKMSGAFEYLKKRGIRRAIIRQINNPLASIDSGILAFIGKGVSDKKTFGFLSCGRKRGLAEGVNVLKKRGDSYCITNVEYMDFKRSKISVDPENGEFYKFPANTNTLFFDVDGILEVLKGRELFGFVLNMKNRIYDGKGSFLAGRLELMMQNIAEEIRSRDIEGLGSYVAFNDRRKTISTAKNRGIGSLETPSSCFSDFMGAYGMLFSRSNISYGSGNPPFVAYINGSIGPIFSDISKKMRGGVIEEGAEVHIDCGDISFKNIQIGGSLFIEDRNIGAKGGRVVLEDVCIKNRGIDHSKKNIFWKGDIKREESLHIVMHGRSLFEARGVNFFGDFFVEVFDGWGIRALLENGKVVFKRFLI